MKIICKDSEDYSEIVIRDDSGVNSHVYNFATKEERKAFWQGLQCARLLASSLVQSIPIDYSLEKI